MGVGADQKTFDAIVVGSGPGGATVARALAKGGQRVLVLERGADYRRRRYYGTYLGALVYSDRRSLLFTEEGLNIVRPLMVGGATSMFAGCAAPPPPWFAGRYGVDLAPEVEETLAELEIEVLPAELRGEGSTRVAEAAQALGYPFAPQLKFMRPARASRFACGAHCMLGCRCGAKWNAAEYVDEAEAHGAELRTGAHVERLLFDGGRVVGVAGRQGGSAFEARAARVVLSAGGIGTPRLLQASGFAEAGEGMAMDATLMVYGTGKGAGVGLDPPMSWSWENEAEGYMLATLIDPWLLFPIMAAMKGPRHLLRWPHWSRTLGVMIKLRDEVSGGVFPDGRIRKPLGARDQARLATAEEVARNILLRAGAEASSLFSTPLRGTHPSATVRLGQLVSRDLEGPARGLYVCDASVFPEALGRPTVLTIIALGKRLARRLLEVDAA